MGSGGATHDLSGFRGQGVDALPLSYVVEFDDWLHTTLLDNDDESLLNYRERAPQAQRNHPIPEHFLPLIVARGAARVGSVVRRLHDGFTYGVLSMAAYAWHNDGGR